MLRGHPEVSAQAGLPGARHRAIGESGAQIRIRHLQEVVHLRSVPHLSRQPCRISADGCDRVVRADLLADIAAIHAGANAGSELGGEFTLPALGAEIAVIASGQTFGRFVLIPRHDVGVSIEERIVAVALVDQLGAALAADASAA